MTKIKKIFLIFILSILVFSFANPVNADEYTEYAKKVRDAALAEVKAKMEEVGLIPRYDWIDLNKFIYIEPNSTSFFGSTTDKEKIEEYKENGNSHFGIKGDSIKEAQKLIMDTIQGTTMISYKALKQMNEHSLMRKDLSIALMQASCNGEEVKSKILSLVKSMRENPNKPEPSDDSMIALNTTYSDYKCFNLIYISSAGDKAPTSTDISFIAGMQSTTARGLLEKTTVAYNTYLKIKKDEEVETHIFSTDQLKGLLNKDMAKSATGACYIVKPTGTNNLCETRIQNDCKPTTKPYFFVHGITCEKLNPLFANQDSSAATISSSDETKELKAKLDIKIQVPFGEIKDGITLPQYINALYKYLLSFGLVLSGILLAIGGFQYIAGKPGEGKTMIVNSITGIVLLSCVYLILETINPATLNLPEIGINEIERDAISADDFGGPTNPEGGSGETKALDRSVSAISNKLAGCSAYLPPVASSIGLKKTNPWTLKCIDITSDTTRITDEAKMLEYTKQYHNNIDNSNEHIVYYISSSGLTWGYLFQNSPNLSWKTVNKKFPVFDEAKQSMVKKNATKNAIWGSKELKTSGPRGVCIAEKSYAISNSETQKNWAKNASGIPTGNDCKYQDLITSKWRNYYKKEDGTYSLQKTGSSRKAGYVFTAPYYKQPCKSNLSASHNNQRLCLSCIGFILNYYACIGRPINFYSATNLVSKGQVITSIRYEGSDVYMNGKKLVIGDVLGWPGGTYSKSENKALLDDTADKLNATITPIGTGGRSTLLKGAKRKENGSMKTRDITVAYVAHVIMYIGNGKTLDWGSGMIRSVKGWSNNITHVVFLNAMEQSLYNKIQSNDNYKYKSCKDIYTELKKRTDTYFSSSDAKKNLYSLPILTPAEIYQRPSKK